MTRSQAGSPTADEPKSITAASRPSATRRLPAAMSPWIQTGGPVHAVVSAGDTYVFPSETPRQVALDYFLGERVDSWVIEEDGRVIGVYKLIPNHAGRGSHVANASFMVDPAAHGKGAGRAMGEHCLAEARRAGYAAMQFNFVVSTNTAAVELWKKVL